MKDLRETGKEYVRSNYGEEFVAEFEEMYDKLADGECIGGLLETATFLDLLNEINKSSKKVAHQCKDCEWLQEAILFGHDSWVCRNPNRHRYYNTHKATDVKYPSQRACKTGFKLKEKR